MEEVSIQATKVCKTCKQTKKTTDFYTDRSYLQSRCKVCSNEARKQSYHKTGYRHNSKLVAEYGITAEDYQKLFDEQQGCCAICGKHQINFKRRLAVDHCHTTLKVRGLLCSPCNTMLGHAKDNVSTLQAAILYLTK